MKLVFCGTPQFAVPTLQALLIAGHDVALVLSQPDKPVGREGLVKPTPVKQAALEAGLAVLQPEKLKTNAALQAQLTSLAPDAIIVVAYGRIIPQWMLDLPRHGCINGHASLLPRWRGAAPIQWAIASGDTETGVTTMLLNAGLDTGPMLLKQSVPITADSNSPELFITLAEIGADLMVQTLDRLEQGSITPEPQNDADATAAPILAREDGRIDFTRTAAEIDQRFRGFQPWPGAFTAIRSKKLIVHGMQVTEVQHAAQAPGTLLSDAFDVACDRGSTIRFTEVQMEGKKRMPAAEFLRGFQVRAGEVLGTP